MPKLAPSSVHLHPPNIVAAMYAGWNLDEMVKPFPEVFRYTESDTTLLHGKHYQKNLAEHTAQNLGIENGIRKFDIVGQKNHGVTAVGKNPWEAFEHIERVEHICQIVLASGVLPPGKKNGKFEKFNGVFDVDGTLTEARQRINKDMLASLRELSFNTEIGLLTGSGLRLY